MAKIQFNVDKNAVVEGIEDTDPSSKSSGSASRFFESGTHRVRILELAGEPMENRYDSTFIDISYILGDDSGRSIRKFLSIPTTENVLFGDRASPRQKRDLDFFLWALGVTVTSETFFKVLPKLFTDPSALVGCELEIDCGFYGPHVKFISPKLYGAFDRDGIALMADGVAITAPTRDEAVALIRRAGLVKPDEKIATFAQILRMKPAEGCEGQLDKLLEEKPKVASKASLLKPRAPF